MKRGEPLFRRFVRRFIAARTGWAGASVSRGAIIDGDSRRIVLGVGTVIEDGAILRVNGGCIRVGCECHIHRGAMIATYGGDIEIGDRCSVNPYTILYGHGGLRIGKDVRIAAHSVIVPANHGFASLDKPIGDQEVMRRGITIEDDVWIGAGVRILDGVCVGRGAVIGAGAVVTRDVVPLSVNAGVPSRIIKMRDGGHPAKEQAGNTHGARAVFSQRS